MENTELKREFSKIIPGSQSGSLINALENRLGGLSVNNFESSYSDANRLINSV